MPKERNFFNESSIASSSGQDFSGALVDKLQVAISVFIVFVNIFCEVSMSMHGPTPTNSTKNVNLDQ